MEKYNFCIHQGETFHQLLKFRNSAGEAIDLTGVTAHSQIRLYPGAESAIADILCTVDEAAGTVSMDLASVYTEMIPCATWAYDLALVKADGKVEYYLGGSFTILQRVTVIA